MGQRFSIEVYIETVYGPSIKPEELLQTLRGTEMHRKIIDAHPDISKLDLSLYTKVRVEKV